ncbi:MAG: two-component regulator propeller domain-containing protein, partial [Flammeovirgaceae bacterium]
MLAQELVGLPFVTNYTTQEYDGGIQNSAITQNAEGVIFVANNFGLLAYDGTNWSRTTLPKETKIRDVFVHESGRVYVASQGIFGYFEPTNYGNVEFVSLIDSLPESYQNVDETWRIFEDNGDLFFCTFSQVFIFKKTGAIQVIDPDYAPESFFFINHKLYVNQLGKGLSYLNGDQLTLVDQGEFFQDKIISGLLPLANQQLWIATRNHGVFIYNGSSYEVWKGNGIPKLASAGINTAIRLHNGKIAIGTQNEGVFITSTDGQLIQHLNKGRGLNNRTVLSMYEDRLGNLWLGHNNGIAMVELNLPFSIISEQIGLPGTGYDGFLFKDRFYLGTSTGLYSKAINESNGVDYQLVKGTEGQVYCIQNVAQFLVLGHHNGAYAIQNGSTQQISDILGAWTFLALKNHPDYVVAGTYKGLLLFKKEGNELRFLHRIRGFSESSRVMDQDESGVIWMSHGYKGVYRLTLSDDLASVAVKYYGKAQGFPSNLLINLWRINNRQVFTTEQAIYRYDQSTDRFVPDEFF